MIPTRVDWTRRRFLERVALAAGMAPLRRCDETPLADGSDGRLTARVRAPTRAAARGATQIGSATLYVPASYEPARAWPLAVLFHGAGQNVDSILQPHVPRADELGLVLVAPHSTRSTWDGIRGEYDDDVRELDTLLSAVFDRVKVDARRIALVGFSDGASYALGLGRINGDLATKIVAYSPGFVTHGAPTGPRAPVFISHGTRDTILPIGATSRRIVPELRADGHTVDYHEFDGGHTVDPDLFRRATAWIA